MHLVFVKVISCLALEIWGNTVLSGYLKGLTNSNAKVGFAEGVQGLSQMLFAFPAGALADRFGRHRILKCSSLLGVIAVTLLIFALYSTELFYTSSFTFALITSGLGFWGCFTGMTNTPLEALYADSTTDENRPTLTQFKFSAILIARSSGPLTSLILFVLFGDYWTLNELRAVFAVGLVLVIPSLVMLFYFDDNKSLSREYRNTPDDKKGHELNESLLNKNSTAEDCDDPCANKSSESLYWVPRILVASDVASGFASGMTIKFFPLFFKEESLMTPGQVSIVLFFSYIGMSITSYIVRIVAEKYGKVNAIVSFQIPGALLLMGIYLMSLGQDISVPGEVPLWRQKILIGGLYVARISLMNCARPLKRSILMAHVPSRERGYWSAFESLKKFGWSGSAVFGGILMDRYGYGITFLATSLIQLGYSTMTLLLKFYLVE